MNSDKAAAVRDSVNGCPDVVDPEDTSGSTDREPYETTVGGEEVVLTGEYVKPDRTRFRPAYIEEVGTIGDGSGATRPVYAVILESLWLDNSDARSLSPELLYEIAKHDCHLRYYPPDHRLDGDIWIVDPFQQDLSDADGDRCECGSTYFKMRDGAPECAKCGRTPGEDRPADKPSLEEFA